MARGRTTTRFLALSLGLVLAIAGCSTGASDTQTTAEARKLIIGISAQPQAMDPTSNPDAAIPQVLLYNVYETLVKVDSEGKLKPLLASEWAVSTDGLTYTFTLQPKAKFSTGTPVDANAVVASIERMRSGATTTDVIKAQMEPIASATATDPGTVTIVLSKPSQAWLWSMASTAGIVIDPTALADMSKPVGSGPYAFGEWKKDESVSLTRNADYWGTAAKFDSATFRYFADANAMNAAMLSGDIDIISNVAAPQAINQFSDTAKYTVTEGTSTAEVILGFNHNNEALSDLKVRQAIITAIDRQALMTTVWNGKGKLIGSMVPPTDPWFEDLSSSYPYDPAKAKALLKEAGFETGLKLRLRVPTLPYAPSSATFITSQLKDVGITVVTDELEFPARWVDVVYTKGDYDMTIVAHAEPRDMDRFADPTYYWHYDNPAYAQLLADADGADEATNVTLMKEAARILADDAAGGFLFLLPNLVVSSADISGLNANATSLSFDLTTLASRDS
ncbi:MAG TPA: ABC transporter substrate-binding protein [Propionibacteriaceae bacterium]|nr:ABC transporter substrate-binding protein [Propionibacteriaceae bacterium]